LAKKYNLPIIIHNRNSGDDILKILEKTQCKNFIIHCFSEDLVFANRCFSISPEAKMSFSGIVTFKNAKSIAETAASIPLKNILIETDAPFLTPAPYR
jgi:TatD DNase family protein